MFLLVSKFKMIGILMNVVHGPGPMKPGGNSAYERVGMLVGNFELNPLKEIDLGVAQAFF